MFDKIPAVQATLAVLLLTLISAQYQAQAQDLDKIVLTVSGKLKQAHPIDLSLRMLEQMPHKTIVTTTPWQDGPISFEGVPLDELMHQAGAEGTEAEFIALNNYRSVLPIQDFSAFGPILAYKMNGSYMKIRDKGPLFVIYPFDDRPELKTEIYFSRSVWQVRSIVIE